MKHTSKIIALFLLVLTVSALVLTACNGGGGTGTTAAPTGSTSDSGSDAGSETTPGKNHGTQANYDVVDPLENKVTPTTYAGKSFHIFTWGYENWNMSTVNNGTIVDQALFEHLEYIEDRTGVAITFTQQDDAWEKGAAYCTELESKLTSGAIPDLICSYASTAAIGYQRGINMNMSTIENLNNFESVWWKKGVKENASIHGGVYFNTGEASTTMLYEIGCLLMNLDKVNEYNLMEKIPGNFEDPYEMVDQDAWTWDNFITMTRDVYADTDTTPGKSVGDEFGFTICGNVEFDQFALSIGRRAMTPSRSSTDVFEIFTEYDETMVTFTATVQDFVYNSEGVGYFDLGNSSQMESGLVCFSTGYLGHIYNTIRNCDFTYGIMPFPKLNQQQENYCSSLSMHYTMYWIPQLAVDHKDPEMSGAVLELLGYDGYKNVSQVLFEQCFKGQYDLTGKDYKIYDILRTNLQFCPARLTRNGDAFGFFRGLMKTNGSWEDQFKTKSDGAKTYLTNWLAGTV